MSLMATKGNVVAVLKAKKKDLPFDELAKSFANRDRLLTLLSTLGNAQDTEVRLKPGWTTTKNLVVQLVS